MDKGLESKAPLGNVPFQVAVPSCTLAHSRLQSLLGAQGSLLIMLSSLFLTWMDVICLKGHSSHGAH